MFTEKLGGGTWISLEFPLTLPDDAKNALLEKWEMANDDGEVDVTDFVLILNNYSK